MLARILTVFRIPELRQKIFLTLILLGVYRMGFFIPLSFLDLRGSSTFPGVSLTSRGRACIKFSSLGKSE